MDRHCLQMAQMCRTVVGAFVVIAGPETPSCSAAMKSAFTPSPCTTPRTPIGTRRA